MQLSKMKWYILLSLHPIHFLESTTCNFFILIGTEQTLPGNIVLFSFFLSLIIYLLVWHCATLPEHLLEQQYGLQVCQI